MCIDMSDVSNGDIYTENAGSHLKARRMPKTIIPHHTHLFSTLFRIFPIHKNGIMKLIFENDVQGINIVHIDKTKHCHLFFVNLAHNSIIVRFINSAVKYQ